ncbi:hypothetical protein [Mesorhizobium sp. M1322]
MAPPLLLNGNGEGFKILHRPRKIIENDQLVLLSVTKLKEVWAGL